MGWSIKRFRECVMPYFNIVAETNENTVVTTYEPLPKRARSLPERGGAGAGVHPHAHAAGL